MKLAQLKALIKQGESQYLEFKSSTGSLSAGMQTICAFLNSSEGGILIFGVKDDGKIVGQQVTDKTRKEIAAELNKIEPYVKFDVKYVPITDDAFIVVMAVKAGSKAPYAYDGRSFMRNQSTTIRMPKDEYIHLYNKNNPTLWESLASDKCAIKDLDHTRIKSVVRKAVAEKRLPEDVLDATIQDILEKLNLLVDDKLTNAAIILFCKNEDKQFMQSSIKLARFRGTDKSVFLDTKEYRGNAFDLYDKADSFLAFALPLVAHIEQGNRYRVETPAIPYSVLREALINALAHRDYSYAGGSIDIAIYDDRVEIANNGDLPQGVDVQLLTQAHKSIPRNPLIANVFYVCRMIERWGRGTVDMIKDCKAAGNPLPIYKEEGYVFSVTLPFKESIQTVVHEKKNTADIFHSDVSRLTDRQKAIINVLKNGPLKMPQIMDQLDITITDRGMQKELVKLAALGFIRSAGKTKATIWSLVT